MSAFSVRLSCWLPGWFGLICHRQFVTNVPTGWRVAVMGWMSNAWPLSVASITADAQV
jgi:hypothetical protein